MRARRSCRAASAAATPAAAGGQRRGGNVAGYQARTQIIELSSYQASRAKLSSKQDNETRKLTSTQDSNARKIAR
jgi:hypothetical protein